MLIKWKEGKSFSLKIIAIIVAILFIYNDIAYAYPFEKTAATSTLSPTSRLNPITDVTWDENAGKYIIGGGGFSTGAKFRQDSARLYIISCLVGIGRELASLKKAGMGYGGIDERLDAFKKSLDECLQKILSAKDFKALKQKLNWDGLARNGDVISLPPVFAYSISEGKLLKIADDKEDSSIVKAIEDTIFYELDHKNCFMPLVLNNRHLIEARIASVIKGLNKNGGNEKRGIHILCTDIETKVEFSFILDVKFDRQSGLVEISMRMYKNQAARIFPFPTSANDKSQIDVCNASAIADPSKLNKIVVGKVEYKSIVPNVKGGPAIMIRYKVNVEEFLKDKRTHISGYLFNEDGTELIGAFVLTVWPNKIDINDYFPIGVPRQKTNWPNFAENKNKGISQTFLFWLSSFAIANNIQEIAIKSDFILNLPIFRKYFADKISVVDLMNEYKLDMDPGQYIEKVETERGLYGADVFYWVEVCDVETLLPTAYVSLKRQGSSGNEYKIIDFESNKDTLLSLGIADNDAAGYIPAKYADQLAKDMVITIDKGGFVKIGNETIGVVSRPRGQAVLMKGRPRIPEDVKMKIDFTEPKQGATFDIRLPLNARTIKEQVEADEVSLNLIASGADGKVYDTEDGDVLKVYDRLSLQQVQLYARLTDSIKTLLENGSGADEISIGGKAFKVRYFVNGIKDVFVHGGKPAAKSKFIPGDTLRNLASAKDGTDTVMATKELLSKKTRSIAAQLNCEGLNLAHSENVKLAIDEARQIVTLTITDISPAIEYVKLLDEAVPTTIILSPAARLMLWAAAGSLLLDQAAYANSWQAVLAQGNGWIVAGLIILGIAGVLLAGIYLFRWLHDMSRDYSARRIFIKRIDLYKERILAGGEGSQETLTRLIKIFASTKEPYAVKYISDAFSSIVIQFEDDNRFDFSGLTEAIANQIKASSESCAVMREVSLLIWRMDSVGMRPDWTACSEELLRHVNSCINMCSRIRSAIGVFEKSRGRKKPTQEDPFGPRKLGAAEMPHSKKRQVVTIRTHNLNAVALRYCPKNPRQRLSEERIDGDISKRRLIRSAGSGMPENMKMWRVFENAINEAITESRDRGEDVYETLENWLEFASLWAGPCKNILGAYWEEEKELYLLPGQKKRAVLFLDKRLLTNKQLYQKLISVLKYLAEKGPRGIGAAEGDNGPICTAGMAWRKKCTQEKFRTAWVKLSQENAGNNPSISDLSRELNISKNEIEDHILKINLDCLKRQGPFLRTRVMPKRALIGTVIDVKGVSFSVLKEAVEYLVHNIDTIAGDAKKIGELAQLMPKSKNKELTKELLISLKCGLSGYVATGAFISIREESYKYKDKPIKEAYCSGSRFYIRSGIIDPGSPNFKGKEFTASLIFNTMLTSLFRSERFIKAVQKSVAPFPKPLEIADTRTELEKIKERIAGSPRLESAMLTLKEKVFLLEDACRLYENNNFGKTPSTRDMARVLTENGIRISGSTISEWIVEARGKYPGFELRTKGKPHTRHITDEDVYKAYDNFVRKNGGRLPILTDLAKKLFVSVGAIDIHLLRINVRRLGNREPFLETRMQRKRSVPEKINGGIAATPDKAYFEGLQDAVKYLSANIDRVINDDRKITSLAPKMDIIKTKAFTRQVLIDVKKALAGHLENGTFIVVPNISRKGTKEDRLAYCSGEKFYVCSAVVDPKLGDFKGTPFVSMVLLHGALGSLFKSQAFISAIQEAIVPFEEIYKKRPFLSSDIMNFIKKYKDGLDKETTGMLTAYASMLKMLEEQLNGEALVYFDKGKPRQRIWPAKMRTFLSGTYTNSQIEGFNNFIIGCREFLAVFNSNEELLKHMILGKEIRAEKGELQQMVGIIIANDEKIAADAGKHKKSDLIDVAGSIAREAVEVYKKEGMPSIKGFLEGQPGLSSLALDLICREAEREKHVKLKYFIRRVQKLLSKKGIVGHVSGIPETTDSVLAKKQADAAAAKAGIPAEITADGIIYADVIRLLCMITDVAELIKNKDKRLSKIGISAIEKLHRRGVGIRKFIISKAPEELDDLRRALTVISKYIAQNAEIEEGPDRSSTGVRFTDQEPPTRDPNIRYYLTPEGADRRGVLPSSRPGLAGPGLEKVSALSKVNLFIGDKEDGILSDMEHFAEQIDILKIKPGDKVLDLGPAQQMLAGLVLALHGCQVDVVDPGDTSLEEYKNFAKHMYGKNQESKGLPSSDEVMARIHTHPMLMGDFMKKEKNSKKIYSFVVAMNVLDKMALDEPEEEFAAFCNSLKDVSVIFCGTALYIDEDKVKKKFIENGFEVTVKDAECVYEILTGYSGKTSLFFLRRKSANGHNGSTGNVFTPKQHHLGPDEMFFEGMKKPRRGAGYMGSKAPNMPLGTMFADGSGTERYGDGNAAIVERNNIEPNKSLTFAEFKAWLKKNPLQKIKMNIKLSGNLKLLLADIDYNMYPNAIDDLNTLMENGLVTRDDIEYEFSLDEKPSWSYHDRVRQVTEPVRMGLISKDDVKFNVPWSEIIPELIPRVHSEVPYRTAAQAIIFLAKAGMITGEELRANNIIEMLAATLCVSDENICAYSAHTIKELVNTGVVSRDEVKAKIPTNSIIRRIKSGNGIDAFALLVEAGLFTRGELDINIILEKLNSGLSYETWPGRMRIESILAIKALVEADMVTEAQVRAMGFLQKFVANINPSAGSDVWKYDAEAIESLIKRGLITSEEVRSSGLFDKIVLVLRKELSSGENSYSYARTHMYINIVLGLIKRGLIDKKETGLEGFAHEIVAGLKYSATIGCEMPVNILKGLRECGFINEEEAGRIDLSVLKVEQKYRSFYLEMLNILYEDKESAYRICDYLNPELLKLSDIGGGYYRFYDSLAELIKEKASPEDARRILEKELQQYFTEKIIRAGGWDRRGDFADAIGKLAAISIEKGRGISIESMKPLLRLFEIEFSDGGNSESVTSNIVEKILSNTPPLKLKESPIPMPVFSSKKSTDMPLAGTEDIASLLKDAELYKVMGRTLVYRTRHSRYIAIKLLRHSKITLPNGTIQDAIEDAGKLVYESEFMDYLNRLKEAGIKLKGVYPKAMLISGNRAARIKTEDMPRAVKKQIDKINSQASNKPNQESSIDESGGCYTLMAYICRTPQYFIYLHEARDGKVDDAITMNMGDLFILARYAMIHPDITELFHNLIQIARPDRGKYVWMTDIVRPTSTRGGAGRLHAWKKAVEYPNMRLSGPADFAEMITLENLVDLENPHSIYLQHDLRRFSLAERKKFLLAYFMGNYILSYALNEGRRVIGKKADPAGQLEESVRKAFGTAYKAFTGKSDDSISALVNWKMLARQMSFFMNGEYAKHIIDNNIPSEIYGSDTKILYPNFVRLSRGWTENGWMFDGKNADLGPVNGPNPMQELIKAMYVYTMFMVLDASLEKPIIFESVEPAARAADGRLQNPKGPAQHHIDPFLDGMNPERMGPSFMGSKAPNMPLGTMFADGSGTERYGGSKVIQKGRVPSMPNPELEQKILEAAKSLLDKQEYINDTNLSKESGISKKVIKDYERDHPRFRRVLKAFSAIRERLFDKKGFTNSDIATALSITRETILQYKIDYPVFEKAIKDSKAFNKSWRATSKSEALEKKKKALAQLDQKILKSAKALLDKQEDITNANLSKESGIDEETIGSRRKDNPRFGRVLEAFSAIRAMLFGKDYISITAIAEKISVRPIVVWKYERDYPILKKAREDAVYFNKVYRIRNAINILHDREEVIEMQKIVPEAGLGRDMVRRLIRTDSELRELYREAKYADLSPIIPAYQETTGIIDENISMTKKVVAKIPSLSPQNAAMRNELRAAIVRTVKALPREEEEIGWAIVSILCFEDLNDKTPLSEQVAAKLGVDITEVEWILDRLRNSPDLMKHLPQETRPVSVRIASPDEIIPEQAVMVHGTIRYLKSPENLAKDSEGQSRMEALLELGRLERSAVPLSHAEEADLLKKEVDGIFAELKAETASLAMAQDSVKQKRFCDLLDASARRLAMIKVRLMFLLGSPEAAQEIFQGYSQEHAQSIRFRDNILAAVKKRAEKKKGAGTEVGQTEAETPPIEVVNEPPEEKAIPDAVSAAGATSGGSSVIEMDFGDTKTEESSAEKMLKAENGLKNEYNAMKAAQQAVDQDAFKAAAKAFLEYYKTLEALNPGSTALKKYAAVKANIDKLFNRAKIKKADHKGPADGDPHARFYATPSDRLEEAVIGAAEAARVDYERERKIAAEFRDTIIGKAYDAKQQGQHIILGLDTTWIENIGVCQAVITELERLPENLRQRGLDNVIFIRGKGDDVAVEIQGRQRETGTRLSNIIVVGSQAMLESEEFNKLRSSDPSESALLIGVNTAKLTFLSDIKLLEMFLIGMWLNKGRAISELANTYIMIEPDEKGRARIFIFTPIEPYNVEDVGKLNRIRIKEINTKA